MKRLLALLLVLSFLMACEPKEKSSFRLPEIPAAFPIPDSIRRPSAKALAQIELGKKMFFDERLSVSSRFSCASCHIPALAFSGGIDRNVGENQGRARRNTPALFNLWHYTSFFHDGGIPRLAEVALAPMDNSHELNLPIDTLVRRLWTFDDYTKAFRKVYKEDASPYTVTRALMWYQLSLISANSKFDQWLYDKKQELSAAEKRGWALFNSARTNCSACHAAPLFTDGQFHHIGYENQLEPDTGRARISMLREDEGKFRTPSLRNLAFTAPYMHDGSFKSLDEVLAHYNRGGADHANKDARIRPMQLTSNELDDLKSFLLTLTDSAFVRHLHYLPSDFRD